MTFGEGALKQCSVGGPSDSRSSTEEQLARVAPERHMRWEAASGEAKPVGSSLSSALNTHVCG